EQSGGARKASTRTCVGCGQRDDAPELLRLVVAGDEVAFDLAGGSFGRGAHLHARPGCIARAPKGLGRAFKGAGDRVDAAELGQRLVAACDRRMAGLLLSAHRLRQVAVGADASVEAMRRGAPVAIVACDAGKVASSREVQDLVAEGRVFAWKTTMELGALLGEGAVAICAVSHTGIAAELKKMRSAAD